MKKTMRPNSAISFSLVLIVPYVALVLGLATVIGMISYRTGHQAVLALSDSLLKETADRIGQAVDRHIVGSGAALEAAFPNGMPAPPDIRTDLQGLRTRFWIATSLHIDPNNYVYYGNRLGQGFGLYRYSLQDGELRLKVEPDQLRSFYKFQGINGKLQFVKQETKLFDPRERPWYKAGQTAGTDTWTSVYIDFGTQELVATRARRVPGPLGTVEGVVATDISLRSLNEFVRELKVSAHGMAFIIEPNGDLIASSASPNVKNLADGTHVRVNAADSGNPTLDTVYREVKKIIPRVDPAGDARTVTFPAPGPQQIHAAFLHIKDTAGLDWFTVVAVPESDFLGEVTANLMQTVLVAALAAFLAIGIGLWILGWVSNDLKRLAAAARQVGTGDLDTPIGITRRDEIGDLARSFEAMQRDLKTDALTGIMNREAFVRRVTQRVESARGSDRDTPFCVVFLDLNGFKQVNDRYGHDVGDQVLVEFADRLRTGVRSGDLVARYAGDEFVVLLGDGPEEAGIAALLINLASLFARPSETILQLSGEQVGLEAALGSAWYPKDGYDAASLLKIADRRMYDDKGK